jgi:GH15 family glucan-1,4-alpha-glucosidase
MQLDVYGELMDVLHLVRRTGLEPIEPSWALQRELLRFLAKEWREPDHGIWEVRGPRRHFTHSKVMAWVAFDRAVREVEHGGLEGPVETWRRVRDEIHAEICARGFDPSRGTFTQFYGSRQVDASLLMLPLVGFLPPRDPRMLGTVRTIERQLLRDGFVQRYPMDSESPAIDGLPPGEGAFLACSFWLADNYALQGRRDEAVALFERLLALRNDVGLLSEQFDPAAARLTGNFPQAFSHVGLINTARNLSEAHGPAEHRREGTTD